MSPIAESPFFERNRKRYTRRKKLWCSFPKQEDATTASHCQEIEKRVALVDKHGFHSSSSDCSFHFLLFLKNHKVLQKWNFGVSIESFERVISCFFLKTSSKFRFRFRAIRLRIECASSRNPIKIWIIHWSRIKGTAQSVEGRRVPFCSSGIGVVVANIASGRQREAVAHGRS